VSKNFFCQNTGYGLWNNGRINNKRGGPDLTLLGAIADRWGFPYAIRTIALLFLAAFPLGLFVKYPQRTPELK